MVFPVAPPRPCYAHTRQSKRPLSIQIVHSRICDNLLSSLFICHSAQRIFACVFYYYYCSVAASMVAAPCWCCRRQPPPTQQWQNTYSPLNLLHQLPPTTPSSSSYFHSHGRHCCCCHLPSPMLSIEPIYQSPPLPLASGECNQKNFPPHKNTHLDCHTTNEMNWTHCWCCCRRPGIPNLSKQSWDWPCNTHIH